MSKGNRSTTLEAIGHDIVRYRRYGAMLRDTAPPWDIRSEAEANVIGDLVAREIDEPIAGWKLGGPDKKARERLKLSAPFVGRVFQSRLWTSPATLDRRMFPCLIPESELAFVLGWDLPSRSSPYTLNEVADAVSHCVLAYEIVDFARPRQQDSSSLDFIADNGGCGGMVVGPPITDWRQLQLSGRNVELSFDGKLVAAGQIGKSIDELLELVVWLANNLHERGASLTAGQYVATGNWTGMEVLQPGQHAETVYAGLGSISVELR